MITIDDFKKLDIRLGTILEASRVPETDRLVLLKIDIGTETRQIVSGIAVYYPDVSVLVGRQVPVLANLEPRKISGVESQGMVLYGVSEESLSTVEPSVKMPDGTPLR